MDGRWGGGKALDEQTDGCMGGVYIGGREERADGRQVGRWALEEQTECTWKERVDGRWVGGCMSDERTNGYVKEAVDGRRVGGQVSDEQTDGCTGGVYMDGRQTEDRRCVGGAGK